MVLITESYLKRWKNNVTNNIGNIRNNKKYFYCIYRNVYILKEEKNDRNPG